MKSHVLFGLGGVPQHDSPLAYKVERMLHWPMILMAILSVPSFYLEMAVADEQLRHLGEMLTTLIFIAFSAELIIMVVLSRRPWVYLLHNWLSVIIAVTSGMAVLWESGDLIPLLRLIRVVFVGILLINVIRGMRRSMTPDAIPNLLFLWALSLALAGAGFYWLEPSIHSYSEGLWLAFVTGATVGYGDVVPTTALSKVFAVIIVLLGYALLSLVTASIAALFIVEDERKMRRLLQQDVKMLQDELRELRREIADYHREQMERRSG